MEDFFMNNCIKDKDYTKIHIVEFKRDIPKPTEMTFILFSYYRDRLMELAVQNQCSLRFTMNKVKISSNVSEEDLDQCFKTIMKKIDSIHYIELTNKERSPIFSSPYFI